MTKPGNERAAIAASWDANADAWTTVVREGRIPSRAAATDAAIVEAVSRYPAGRALDVGCGEGWLARALHDRGFDVVGVDGSARLVEHAREAGGGVFHVATYDDLIGDGNVGRGPFALIVLNFALIAEDVAPLLRALVARLGEHGVIIVQTVHPWVACGDAPYRDGWRVETFDAFGGAFAAPMPWYFRTLGSWLDELRAAGLTAARIEEPMHPDTGRPLSLLLTCQRS